MANFRKPARFACIVVVLLLSVILSAKFGGWVSAQARAATFPTTTETGANAATSTAASGAADTPTSIQTTTQTNTFTPTPTDSSNPVPGPYCELWQYSYRGFKFATSYRWPVRLRAGEILAANFVVDEGKNVSFRIEDPSGKTIYDSGQVTASDSFNITARETGVYRLLFDKDCFFCARAVGFNYRIF